VGASIWRHRKRFGCSEPDLGRSGVAGLDLVGVGSSLPGDEGAATAEEGRGVFDQDRERSHGPSSGNVVRGATSTEGGAISRVRSVRVRGLRARPLFHARVNGTDIGQSRRRSQASDDGSLPGRGLDEVETRRGERYGQGKARKPGPRADINDGCRVAKGRHRECRKAVAEVHIEGPSGIADGGVRIRLIRERLEKPGELVGGSSWQLVLGGELSQRFT